MPLRPLTISGTATDAAGNMASASVSVSINEPTLFGSSVITSDGVNHYSDFDAMFGDIKISRTYSALNKDPDPYDAKYSVSDVSYGMASAHSFKYYPSDVLSGSKDAVISAIFTSFPKGRTRWWTYWHEPDDEIYSTSTFTSADYKAAWAHVNSLAQAHVPTGVDARPFLCVMEYSMRAANDYGPSTPRPFDGMYPGDFIRAIGFDTYSGWDDKTPYTLTPSDQFDKLFSIGQQYGKPICFPEFGSGPTPPTGVSLTRSQWMTNALRYLKPHADQISFICWWCDGFANLTGYSSEIAIWKAMCMNGWAGTP